MKIFDERGLTLYELLATLVITMIVLPVIYGVFSSGIKLYNKVQVEGQLRDDADYTVTMIMNTFYSFPFDYVRTCGDNCIELVDNTYTDLQKENREQQTFYSINQKKKYEEDEETTIELKLGEIDKNGTKMKVFMIDNKPIDVVSDFIHSELTLSCEEYEECEETEAGMISLTFHLDDKRINRPLILKSQFGF